MRIDKDSYGTLAVVYCVSLTVIALMCFAVHNAWISWPVCLLFLWFMGWQTFFFRLPRRNPAGNAKKVSSVADGKVVIIEKVYEPECLKKECIQISVYMDFWNVHANYWPIDGEVTYYKYHPGKHLLAFKPKASEENEHSCICVRNSDGQDVFFKQLAGTFARRIVSYATPGLKTDAGLQCGIIKFGSRIDMYLPLDSKICVSLGQEVRACETILAELS